jgi:peptidoglycan/xylan/chitin deacetylase (PgdA/CDA1 family)
MAPKRSIMNKLHSTVAKLLKEILGRLLVVSGVYCRALEGKAIVVAFHSITPQQSDSALRCSVRDFDRYCRFFGRHMKPVTLTELIGRVRANRRLGCELSITFDDGYADNAELALPVLSRWRLPATFFVATGFVDSELQTPWDRNANVRSRWMTWQQVAQLAAAGHDIGAHTVTHADLGQLSDADAENELRRSRDELDARTGAAPRHFAIPFGRTFASINEVAVLAERLGFLSMSLCRGGMVDRSTRAMHVERWPIDPTDYLSPYGWAFDVIRESRTASAAQRSLTGHY